MGQNHHIRNIPIKDHKRFTSHDIDKEVKDIDLGSLLETLNEKWCIISSIAEFTEFWKNVVQNNFGKNLKNEGEVLHFLIFNQSRLSLS